MGTVERGAALAAEMTRTLDGESLDDCLSAAAWLVVFFMKQRGATFEQFTEAVQLLQQSINGPTSDSPDAICASCKHTRAWHKEHRPRHRFVEQAVEPELDRTPIGAAGVITEAHPPGWRLFVNGVEKPMPCQVGPEDVIRMKPPIDDTPKETVRCAGCGEDFRAADGVFTAWTRWRCAKCFKKISCMNCGCERDGRSAGCGCSCHGPFPWP